MIEMNRTKKCENCGQLNFDNATHCGYCGHHLMFQKSKKILLHALAVLCGILLVVSLVFNVKQFISNHASSINFDKAIVVNTSNYSKQLDGYYILDPSDSENLQANYTLDDKHRLVKSNMSYDGNSSLENTTEISYSENSIHIVQNQTSKSDDGNASSIKQDKTIQFTYKDDLLSNVQTDTTIDMDSQVSHTIGQIRYAYDENDRLQHIYQVSKNDDGNSRTVIDFSYFEANGSNIVVETNKTTEENSTSTTNSQLVSVYLEKEQNKDIFARLGETNLSQRKTLHALSDGLYTDYVQKESFTGSERYLYQQLQEDESVALYGNTSKKNEMKYFYKDQELIFVEGSQNENYYGTPSNEETQSIQIMNINNDKIAITKTNTKQIKEYINGRNESSNTDPISLDAKKEYAQVYTLSFDDQKITKKEMILDKKSKAYKQLKEIKPEDKSDTEAVIDKAIAIVAQKDLSTENDTLNEMMNEANESFQSSMDASSQTQEASTPTQETSIQEEQTANDQIPLEQIPGDNFAGLETGQYILQYTMNTRVSPDYNAAIVGKLVKGVPVHVIDMVEGENGSVWGKLIHGNWICLQDNDYVYATLL